MGLVAKVKLRAEELARQALPATQQAMDRDRRARAQARAKAGPLAERARANAEHAVNRARAKAEELRANRTSVATSPPGETARRQAGDTPPAE